MYKKALEELSIYTVEDGIDFLPLATVKEIYLRDMNRYIYIVGEGNMLRGILSVGSVKNRVKDKVFYMKSFTAMEGWEDIDKQMMLKNPGNHMMAEMPVVDGEGHILGSYSKDGIGTVDMCALVRSKKMRTLRRKNKPVYLVVPKPSSLESKAGENVQEAPSGESWQQAACRFMAACVEVGLRVEPVDGAWYAANHRRYKKQIIFANKEIEYTLAFGYKGVTERQLQAYLKVKKNINILKNLPFLGVSKLKLFAYHNKYKGQRCFIVGNGPSLRIEDLERLEGEYTFGSNRIYSIFDETSWRPTFYGTQDPKFISGYPEDIVEMSKVSTVFIPIRRGYELQRTLRNKAIFLNWFMWKDPEKLYFSDNVAKCVVDGMTITYTLLQIAAYMGFSKIYLLGCDNQYSMEVLPDSTVVVNEQIQDHFKKDEETRRAGAAFWGWLMERNLAYETARKYADSHGIEIYNATRGGKLDAFERVDFDEIFTR